MGLHMKPDIDSDISLSAVTEVFCILRDVTIYVLHNYRVQLCLN